MVDKTEKTPDEINDELAKAIAGMRQADTDVDAFPMWDFDKQGPLRAVVVKIKQTVQIRRGNEVDVRLAIVDHNGDNYILWESANLGEFFDEIGAGSTIIVIAKGWVELAGSKRMRVYDAYFS